MRSARLGFRAPGDISAFVVKERLKGDATTDFGAPAIAPSYDARPVGNAELRRLHKILRGCWRAFDQTTEMATGRSLRKGPRGGGRDLERIFEHVLGADEGYLSAVGWKLQRNRADASASQLQQTRQSILTAVTASAHGEIPAKGPRGGIRWSPRYFVRRVAWHTLDHLWEIEDRVLSE
jgi:hypothetical protein